MSVTKGLASLGQGEAEGYYKIIYIKSGPCNFVLNEKEFILTGACVICMNDEDTILFRRVCEEDVSILWFKPNVINSKLSIKVINNPNRRLTTTEHQDIYYLNQFVKEAKVSAKVLSLHTMEASGIEYRLQMIGELLVKQDSPTWPCKSRSYLLEILFCLTRQEEAEEENLPVPFYERDARFAFDVIYYLQSCYNEKITIERLTEQFHTNRTTLLSDFKKATGLSVNQYLVELRLKMAIMLLRDTELSVEEISGRTGFHDISYFSKVFKRRLSCTPSEYRKINKCDPYGNKYS
jgi:AraC family L-rhamnose operon regulatory protein RhaS